MKEKAKSPTPAALSLANNVSRGRRAELIAEMIETALGFGRDDAHIADLKLYSCAMAELRRAAKLFAKYKEVRKVSVFGSARTKPDAAEYQVAKEFSARMVEHGYMVITGGGDGIMGAAQEGAGAEKSFGLNIELPFEQKANETIRGNEKLLNFRYFFTRKLNFVKETHAVCLCPGGFGTHDEGFETLTLIQTGKTPIVPVVYLDRPNGHYWEMLRRFIVTDILGQGLISEADLNLFFVTHSIDEAIEHILAFYRVFHSYRWVRQQMVIRINHKLSEAALAKLNHQFASLLVLGRIEQRKALPEERDEPTLRTLPRLVLTPRKEYGNLRTLIDAINGL